jgi:hypothetical protein
LQELTQKIVLSDNESLKQRKIDEFTVGELPDGGKIGTYRDADYYFFKREINPFAGGYVDLMLTRTFVNSMRVSPFTNGTYLFRANDPNNLGGRYGMDIFGLNQEWFTKRQQEIYIYPLLRQIKSYAKIS